MTIAATDSPTVINTVGKVKYSSGDAYYYQRGDAETYSTNGLASLVEVTETAEPT